jgi:type II secretory pathway predicted ATPase ExeA
MAEARIAVSPAKVFARPTADQLWLGPSQQAALSRLSGTARIRALLGPASCGKTTLLHHLAFRAGSDAVVLHLKGPKEDAAGVLATLLLNAGLASWDLSEIEQRNLLSVFVQQRRSQGRRVLVVVDDAHGFQPAAWEEIERLLAFRVEQRPAIDLLVSGPASLAERLPPDATPSGIVRHILEAPSESDLSSYLDWRLARFEMGDVFTPVASQMIVRLSEGRFGAIDVLCQMSLLLRRQMRTPRVDARLARRAITSLAARQAAKGLHVGEIAGSKSETLPGVCLLVSRDGKVLDEVTLTQRTLLGRSEHNDVCLPSPYLSRHHAAIVGTPEGYYIVDLNSANGLALNGRRVERAVLNDQDVLTMGPFKIKVQMSEWVPDGDPLPEDTSLADTAMLPPAATPGAHSRVRRVK